MVVPCSAANCTSRAWVRSSTLIILYDTPKDGTPLVYPTGDAKPRRVPRSGTLRHDHGAPRAGDHDRGVEHIGGRGAPGRRGAAEHPRLKGNLPRPRSEEHTSELQSQSNLVCR